MPTPDAITTAQLSRLIGTADAPLVIDVRTDEDQAADPSALPASIRRDHRTVASWAKAYAGRSVAVVCTHGAKLSQGAAACRSTG
jgi:rhodanese-related sulfurtransferase